MTSLITTRDVYGPVAEGGPISHRRARVHRLSAPRERTLTEFEMESRIEREERDLDYECERHYHEQECGD